MFFSNISNNQLEFLRGINMSNFSINLSDMLESDLFVKETVVADSMFRIYPLFNCKEIKSSNDKDIILDNKCIICTKNELETYFTFINDVDKPIHIYRNFLSFFQIGDKLNTDEYNSIIQIVRTKYSNREEINIENGSINGLYGIYNFNLESATIIDNGILITPETLSSLGTVTLTDPLFKYSSYVLILKVYSYGDSNIITDGRTNEINETVLRINLVNGAAIQIPFDTLDLQNIVSFDATVEISHNVPVTMADELLVLTSNSNNIYIDKPITLSATLTDEYRELEIGKTVTFKNGNTTIGTAITDNNGVATLIFTPESGSSFDLKCIYNQVVSNIVSPVYSGYANSISISTNKSVIGLGSSVLCSIVLTNVDGDVENKTIKIYNGQTLIDTVVTNENGEAGFIYTPNSEGQYSFSAHYKHSSSSSVNVSVSGISITLESDANSLDTRETLHLSGELKLGTSGFSNQSVNIYANNTLIDTVTSDSSGNFICNANSNVEGTVTYYAEFVGGVDYGTKTSSTISVFYNDNSPNTLTMTVDNNNIDIGDTIEINGEILDIDSEPSENYSIDLYNGDTLVQSQTTNSSGTVSFNYTPEQGGTFDLKLKYGSKSSNIIQVTVTKITPTITCSSNTGSTNTGSSVTISGKLSVNNVGIASQTIYIYDGNSQKATVVTDSNGNYSANITISSSGTHSLHSANASTSTYNSVSSSNVSVTAKYPTSISWVTNCTSGYSYGRLQQSQWLDVVVPATYTLEITVSGGSSRTVYLTEQTVYGMPGWGGGGTYSTSGSKMSKSWNITQDLMAVASETGDTEAYTRFVISVPETSSYWGASTTVWQICKAPK